MPMAYIETWNDFNNSSGIEPSIDYGYYFNVMTRNHARVFKGSLSPDSVGVENPGLLVPQHLLQARRAAMLRPQNSSYIMAKVDTALNRFFDRRYYEALYIADYAAGIAPEQLKIEDIDGQSVELSWEPSQHANSYNIYFSL